MASENPRVKVRDTPNFLMQPIADGFTVGLG
jgi:hypothetical protein